MIKKLFLLFTILIFTNAFAYCRSCKLVSQTNDYDRKTVICDYQCNDGSSKTRYINADYCPAEIGCL